MLLTFQDVLTHLDSLAAMSRTSFVPKIAFHNATTCYTISRKESYSDVKLITGSLEMLIKRTMQCNAALVKISVTFHFLFQVSFSDTFGPKGQQSCLKRKHLNEQKTVKTFRSFQTALREKENPQRFF